MKAISNKINYFTPVDNKGQVHGNYYLNATGDLVEAPKGTMMTPVILPYAVSVNIDSYDDIIKVHASELQEMLNKLKANIQNVTDETLKYKYVGYIEMLEYLLKYESHIDPWADFIHSIEEDYYGLNEF